MRLINDRALFQNLLSRRGPLGTVLAMDVGSKRVGLALSDPTLMLASPLVSIPRTFPETSPESTSAFAAKVAVIVRQHRVSAVVVGLPLLDGLPTRNSHGVLAFVRALSIEPSLALLPCLPWDESFTTSEARALLKRSSGKRSVFLRNKDTLAASLILQRYLEETRA